MLNVFLSLIINFVLISSLYSLEITNKNVQNAVQLSDSMNKISVGLASEYLEDKKSQFSIDDILQNNIKNAHWIKSENEALNFGITDSTYWVRFSAINSEDHDIDFAIEVDLASINTVEFYFPEKNRGYIMKRSGNLLPFKERDISYRNVIFKAAQPSNTEYVYYMKFKSIGPMNIPLWIWSPDSLPDKIIRESVIFGLYHGMTILVVLFVFFVFIKIREVYFLYYILWIGANGVYQASINGLAYQFFWPNDPFFAFISIAIFIYLANIGCLQFGNSFLDLKNNLPVLNKISKLIVIISIAGIILLFTPLFKLSVPLVLPSVFSVMVIMLTAGFIAIKWKDQMILFSHLMTT